MGRFRVHFRGIRVIQTTDMSCKFNDCQLETQAKTQKGDVLLSCQANGLNFSLGAPGSKPAGDHQTVNLF